MNLIDAAPDTTSRATHGVQRQASNNGLNSAWVRVLVVGWIAVLELGSRPVGRRLIHAARARARGPARCVARDDLPAHVDRVVRTGGRAVLSADAVFGDRRGHVCRSSLEPVGRAEAGDLRRALRVARPQRGT
jgi:hypothetical protein